MVEELCAARRVSSDQSSRGLACVTVSTATASETIGCETISTVAGAASEGLGALGCSCVCSTYELHCASLDFNLSVVLSSKATLLWSDDPSIRHPCATGRVILDRGRPSQCPSIWRSWLPVRP